MSSTVKSFSPAQTSYYTDESGREFDFVQSVKGDVSVRVHYGLKEIGTVFQENIFIYNSTVGLKLSNSTPLSQMSTQQKKGILTSLTKSLNKNALDSESPISIENGNSTTIKHRQNGQVLSAVRSITLY